MKKEITLCDVCGKEVETVQIKLMIGRSISDGIQMVDDIRVFDLCIFDLYNLYIFVKKQALKGNFKEIDILGFIDLTKKKRRNDRNENTKLRQGI